MCYNGRYCPFTSSWIDFTNNLIDRKIMKFRRCGWNITDKGLDFQHCTYKITKVGNTESTTTKSSFSRKSSFIYNGITFNVFLRTAMSLSYFFFVKSTSWQKHIKVWLYQETISKLKERLHKSFWIYHNTMHLLLILNMFLANGRNDWKMAVTSNHKVVIIGRKCLRNRW